MNRSTERTVVLIKPHLRNSNDFIGIMCRIIESYCKQGLRVILIRNVEMTTEMAENFYYEHQGRDYFPGLVKAMTGTVIALLLEGEGAIIKVREVNGATDPRKAAPDSLRAKYGVMEYGPNNAVHGSDSSENVERETRIMFM